MKPSCTKMMQNSCFNLEELIEYIEKSYNSGSSLNKIASCLGVSLSTIRRFCKDHDIKTRTKKEQLEDLHKATKGRKWTNEQAKKNVSIAVKKSYDEELRKSRSESNKNRWKEWDKEKRKQVVSNGLVAMHKVRHNSRNRKKVV